MGQECNVRKKGTANSNCPTLPGMPKSMYVTTPGFTIPAATVASGPAALKTFMNAAVLTRTVNRFPDFDTVENISQEAVFEDVPLSYKKVKDGNYRFTFGISNSLCMHKALYTYRSRNCRVIIVDNEDQWFLTELSDGSFAGWTVQELTTNNMLFNDGSVTSKSPVVVAFSNHKEWNKNGAMLDASDFNEEIYKIIDAEITIVTASDDEIVVDVLAECDGTPITGLLVADFVGRNPADTAAIVITTAPPVAGTPGRYTLTSAGGLFVDEMTINLRAADLLTVKPYESVGAVEVAI